MASGTSTEWLVGVAQWGYKPAFSEEFEKQLTKGAYEKLSAEFKGRNLDEIDTELFRRSEEALNALVASNNQLTTTSVAQGQNDPVGLARQLQAAS